MTINLELLTILGLTSKDASVYCKLLELGPSNAGAIISACKLHRQFVYNALEHLQSLQLVSTVTRKNRKLFQAADPSRILEIQEERTRSLAKLVPDLNAIKNKSSDLINVQVLFGVEEYIKNLYTVLESAYKTDKKVRLIGGASSHQLYDILGDRYQDYAKFAKKHRIRKFLIASESSTDQFYEFFKKEPGNELRTMRLGLSSPTFTRITEELTTIEIFSHEIIIIQIFNKEVAKGYLENFNLLWQQAKKT